MAIVQPNLRPAIWAETGDQTAPSTGEQQSGYVAGKPSRRKTNWLLNWLDNAIQFVLTLGIPTYNVSATYNTNARTQYGGDTYKCLADGVVGVTPGTDPSKWIKWGYTTAELAAYVGNALGTLSGTLADGTITTSTTATVGYARALRFPGGTDKMVCFLLHLTNTMGGYSTVITLSGAAAFGTNTDGVTASLTDSFGSVSAGTPDVRAVITANNTISVGVAGLIGAGSPVALNLEIRVRGY